MAAPRTAPTSNESRRSSDQRPVFLGTARRRSGLNDDYHLLLRCYNLGHGLVDRAKMQKPVGERAEKASGDRAENGAETRPGKPALPLSL
jgi:hypothetical protein